MQKIFFRIERFPSERSSLFRIFTVSLNVNKNIGFLCIRMYLFVLYYALLSQNFEHLLLNNMHCYHYYNV